MNNRKPTILVADDDTSVLQSIETIFEIDGTFKAAFAKEGASAQRELLSGAYDVALLDLRMPELDGLQVMRAVKDAQIDTAIIMVTGHGSVDTAVEAMKLGAYDFIQKPVDANELLSRSMNVLERVELIRQNIDLKRQLASLIKYQDLIGKSPLMQEMYQTLDAVSGTDASVLILGESGTGKELVAHAIHQKSNRTEGEFIAVNCAALPANILESELFGHEKGAFTGAVRDKKGVFEQADGGTIFLDELAEMPYELQAKLLRVLETGTFRRVGGQSEIKVNVRVLAATNKNPRQAVADKKLREDLYYRVAVMEIELPALRNRVEDIPLLAQSFLEKFNDALRKNVTGFSPEALEALLNHEWPGNVRELRNAIERAVILCRGEEIEASNLPAQLQTESLNVNRNYQPQENSDMLIVQVGTTVAKVEERLIQKTLAACGNNKTHAAKKLGISLKTLHNKLGKYI